MGNGIAPTTGSKRRVIGFDFIKTVAILLVITIHMIGGSTLPHTWYTHIVSTLTMVCVPLFVMVNGALMLTRPFDGKKHKRRIIQLIALTLIWKVILLVFCYCTLDYEVDLSKSSIVSYLLGGNPPYGNIGYIWFLNFYIGLMILYPVLKFIFDAKGTPLKYLLISLLILAVGDTLDMLYLPASHILGLNTDVSVFGYFDSFGMFTWSAALVAMFMIGGLVWEWHMGGEKPIRKETGKTTVLGRIVSGISSAPIRSAAIVSIVCFAILWALVKYKCQFIEPGTWDLAQRYSNILNICLTTSLFYLLSIAHYPKPLARFSVFMGSRTFSIYIMHIAAMNGITALMNTGILPTGAGLPGAIDLLYLLSVYLISEFLLAVFACLIEKIPYAKALLFK